ncbi:MAG: hypothetical protein CL897_00295 [Dehalococcoidia bacterium]|nr:hypothetical protein [Dehalococcoidia bacterium]
MIGLALDATSGARRLLAGLASPDVYSEESALGSRMWGGGPLRWFVAAVVVASVVVAATQIADGALLVNGFGKVFRRPELLFLFLGGYAAAFLLRAVAWKGLLGPSGAGVSGGRLFAILHAALFANHALPVKAGEVLRPFLGTRAGLNVTDATVSTAVARLLDLAALFAIAAALIPLTVGIDGLTVLIGPACLLLALVAVLLWFRGTTATWSRFQAVERLWIRTRDALRVLSPRTVIGAFVLTVPSWILEAVVVYSAAHALGFEISLPVAMAVTAFTIFFQVFHITPGGIGVYEASMIAALQVQGMPGGEALTLAVLTHGLKFLYAFGIGGVLMPYAFGSLPTLGKLRGSRDDPKPAGRLENVAARLWNVLNEGKPFTPVFVLGTLVLLGLPHLTDGGYWVRQGIAVVALLPLFAVFYRYAFPLRLRAGLWVLLAVFLAAFRFVDPVAIGLVLALYLGFTVVLWGSIYYHLRIGTPWTNGFRFWRLVLENPDPTSGNFLEQVPKLLILVLLSGFLVEHSGPLSFAAVEGFTLGAGLLAVLTHQWWFTWAPPDPLTPTHLRNENVPVSRRVILIVIDGCRPDRLAEARTPFLDSLAAQGLVCGDMRTVYPARTVTAFTSMLTGAPPSVHGMRSNFVPSLGVKCKSIFDALKDHGMHGRLVGIAHLVDSFGDRTVETVTAVTPNEEIDDALVSRAKAVLKNEDPELLVLQTLSVDQTGHARGSYYPEYLERIEATDHLIEDFLAWCREEGYLEGATVIVTSDHGQGKGIGGHGHLTEPEKRVPFIAWGEGIPQGLQLEGSRSLLDVAPTLAYYLGVSPPEQSVGQVLFTPKGVPERGDSLAIVIPAYNEAEALPDVLARIPRQQLGDVTVIVVDDGSTDATAVVAEREGADLVVRHSSNLGLGAALRTGLETARGLDARAAVYLDADLEYDPAEIPALLAPIETGEADYVLGSRFLGTRHGHRLFRSLGNRVFTLVLSVLTGRRISDGQTGFRAFSASALNVAEIVHDYNYAQVLTLNLLHKGMRLAEVPITYRSRTSGRSFINANYLWRVPFGMAREVLGNQP